MITMGSVNDENDIDLVNNHAYSFIRTIQLRSGERLVQVRNPWGTEKYSGPWSDKEEPSRWTDEAKRDVGYEDANDMNNDLNDGAFYMPIDYFRREFGLVWINYDPSGLWRDDWLILDDRTNNPGEH